MSLDEEGMTAEAIDIHMSRLRKKLRDSGCTAVIRTHYGLGHALEADGGAEIRHESMEAQLV